ncbi:MAG: hypothetical protein ABI175_07025, partial [Polyangiales bacterium]
CIAIPVTRTLGVGVRCDAFANPPEIECNCVHDHITGVGVCASVCSPSAAETTCPDGFLCTTGLPRVYFPAEPSGVVAHCLPACTSDDDCSAFAGRCIDGPRGKTCVVQAAPGP